MAEIVIVTIKAVARSKHGAGNGRGALLVAVGPTGPGQIFGVVSGTLGMGP
jgi:hypothetical protein